MKSGDQFESALLAAEATAWARCQFERIGYFRTDPDSAPSSPVFNRTVTLRNTRAKIVKRPSPSA